MVKGANGGRLHVCITDDDRLSLVDGAPVVPDIYDVGYAYERQRPDRSWRRGRRVGYLRVTVPPIPRPIVRAADVECGERSMVVPNDPAIFGGEAFVSLWLSPVNATDIVRGKDALRRRFVVSSTEPLRIDANIDKPRTELMMRRNQGLYRLGVSYCVTTRSVRLSAQYVKGTAPPSAGNSEAIWAYGYSRRAGATCPSSARPLLRTKTVSTISMVW